MGLFKLFWYGLLLSGAGWIALRFVWVCNSQLYSVWNWFSEIWIPSMKTRDMTVRCWTKNDSVLFFSSPCSDFADFHKVVHSNIPGPCKFVKGVGKWCTLQSPVGCAILVSSGFKIGPTSFIRGLLIGQQTVRLIDWLIDLVCQYIWWYRSIDWLVDWMVCYLYDAVNQSINQSKAAHSDWIKISHRPLRFERWRFTADLFLRRLFS